SLPEGLHGLACWFHAHRRVTFYPDHSRYHHGDRWRKTNDGDVGHTSASARAMPAATESFSAASAAIFRAVGRAVLRLTSLPSDFTRDSHRSAERLGPGQATACAYPRLATQIMQRVLRT